MPLERVSISRIRLQKQLPQPPYSPQTLQALKPQEILRLPPPAFPLQQWPQFIKQH